MAQGKNIAIIGGDGKLGQAIHKLADPSYHIVNLPRNARYPLSVLHSADVIVVAVPAKEFNKVYPLVLAANRHAIIATTGHAWPENIDSILYERGITWVHSKNFAFDMQPIRHQISELGRKLRDQDIAARATLTETHDVKKQDRPSGTALLWRDWLGIDKIQVRSRRIAGALPKHRLKVTFNDQNIVITHEAKSRRIYAEGILWTAAQIAEDHIHMKGLVLFERLQDQLHPLPQLRP
ncbi:MAG TPA: dihydrodipicolinate reductase C-terminal domain-containing protein [Alphaproteobacteria bacterium]